MVCHLAIGIIRLYQSWKWVGLIPATCRFTPSCSEYAAEVFKRYGLFQGMRRVGSRIIRCRPGVIAGHDPVD